MDIMGEGYNSVRQRQDQGIIIGQASFCPMGNSHCYDSIIIITDSFLKFEICGAHLELRALVPQSRGFFGGIMSKVIIVIT
jgi:hypothetical protein